MLDTTTAIDLLADAGITFVTGVPDSGFKALISDLETTTLGDRYVLATREDSAVALATGAHLAGHRALVFMESSGFGNALDVLTSLAIAYEVPLVLLIAWAGYEGRDVPHHNAIGEPMPALLAALGLPAHILDDLGGSRLALRDAVAEALQSAEAARRPAVVLGVPPELAAPEASE